jgi:hypothetical protein
MIASRIHPRQLIALRLGDDGQVQALSFPLLKHLFQMRDASFLLLYLLLLRFHSVLLLEKPRLWRVKPTAEFWYHDPESRDWRVVGRVPASSIQAVVSDVKRRV